MQICKTNPPEHSGTSPLTYRQLAAARFLVRGHGSVETARRLGVARHTVARWKHNPVFIAEVERLRERLTRAALAPLSADHLFNVRPPRDDDAEMDAFINILLRQAKTIQPSPA